MPGPLHTQVHRAAYYDTLRQEVMRNGAIQSPTPQSEVPSLSGMLHSLMESSGIGQAWTTSRGSRTYTGGAVTPQTYVRASGGPGTEEQLINVPMQVNARASYPGRGMSPLRRRS